MPSIAAGPVRRAAEGGSSTINGLPLDTDERLIRQLRSITAAEVQAVAARYFGDDQLTIATLLPQPPDPSRQRRAPAAAVRH